MLNAFAEASALENNAPTLPCHLTVKDDHPFLIREAVGDDASEFRLTERQEDELRETTLITPSAMGQTRLLGS